MYALRFVISIPFLTLLFCSCEQNEHPPTVEDQEFEVSESGYFFIQHPTIKASDLLIGTLDRDSHESSFHGVLDDLFIHGRVVEIYEFKRLYPEF